LIWILRLIVVRNERELSRIREAGIRETPMNTPYWFSNLAYWSAQVALLVLAAGFLPHLFKIHQPRVLLIYWRALIVISLLLPFAQPWHQTEIFSTITFAPRFGEFSPMVITRANRAATHWHFPSASTIAEIIGLIILAGIAARFTILALGLLKLRQFREASSPVSNLAESSALLDEMRLRVNTGGEFRISSGVDSPVTFGLTAPVILLPKRFPALDARHQAAIACHELLHVRRRDWAHHLCEEILRATLWFHPAIAWLIARIRLSREQVVDLEVVRLTDARKPYLEALLEFTSSRALATAIPAPPFLAERQLAERVALILKEVRMSRVRLIASLTAIAACLAVVATLAVWAFPLKAAPRAQNPPIGGIAQGVSGGVTDGVIIGVAGGVPGGVMGGVTRGVPGGITGGAPTQGVKDGVSGGIDGVKTGVPGGIVGGITNVAPVPQQNDTSTRTVALPATKKVPPVYPRDALENHLEGRVDLALTINSDGKVSDVEVVNGSPQFVQAATDAAYQWKFQQPAKPPAIISARFIFTLSPTRRTHESQSLEPRDPPKDPRAVSSINVEVVSQDPLPQSAPTPATNNDSRFIGKFQYIPPADASSGKVQNIPPVIVSPPSRGLTVGPGQPPPATNQGVFLNVAPAAPANSRNPNSQNTTSSIPRAGQNGITMPICEYCPRPEYSPEAREANIQGTVYLQIIVLTTGRAGEIKVIKGFEKSLDEQAIKAVREQWTFKPATDRNGDPVDVIVPVEIAFQLYGPPQPTPPAIGRPAAASPATAPLTPNETLQTRIFTGPVTDDGKSTSFYMGLVKAQTVHAPQPELPRLARQANVQGPVTLNIIVNTEGKVIVAEYVKGPAMLVQSAINSARNWIIKGTHEGVPVTFQISVEVSFTGDK
jgi:TonB family protein